MNNPHPLASAVGQAGIPESLSARRLLSRGQCAVAVSSVGLLLGLLVSSTFGGIGLSPMGVARGAVVLVTGTYLVVIAFRSVLVHAAAKATVLRYSAADLRTLDEELPTYALLVPLYREEAVLAGLIQHLSLLDYPADRLHIQLLVEEDDQITRGALEEITLDSRFEIVPVPPGGPRTKPNACNVGLARTDAELCVIYDAEDRPEPDQLRKAVAALGHCPDDVVCVQAELTYWNPWTNALTRWFAAEYALNFALVLRGLDGLRLPIPLGGTSNHFRTAALRELGGWDPHNVTEDADLGVRIARRGWRVRLMDSMTWEEANSALGNWVRQRSRWIKGYLQTWLVHMRRPGRLWADLGPRGFVGFQLIFALNSLVVLVNPAFWALTGWCLVAGPERVTQLYPGAVLYVAVTAMVAGNLVTTYHFMVACLVRRLHRALPLMPLAPLYWMLMSAAGYRAVVQLLRPGQRHYWDLTRHGLVTVDEPGHAPFPVSRRERGT